MASLGPFAPASPPMAPHGWHTSWSEQHNQWYYVDTATGFSQWERPSGSAEATKSETAPQSSHQYSDQQQYHQQENSVPQGDAQQESSRGLVSMAAVAILGHQMHEHSHHHHDQHNILGSVTALVGSAGVSALGAKLFGGKKQPKPTHNAPSPSNPPFPGYHTPPPPAQYYPTHTPPQPVHTGQPIPSGNGHCATGAAGAAAAVGVMSMTGNSGSNYHQQHQQPQPQHQQYAGPHATAAYSGTSTYHGGPSFAGPRLTIHAAAFADKNVTDKVRMLVNPDQQISIHKKMVEEFGDPWPEAERKGLSILYQYGDRPMEVWAGDTTDEVVAIKNEALSNQKMAFVNKNPGRVVSLIWGEENVLTDIRREKLEKEGELDCKDLGNGNWWAWEQRTLVCYYRGQNGGIEIACARENGTLRLPWNPLAKWS